MLQKISMENEGGEIEQVYTLSRLSGKLKTPENNYFRVP
jgi:hypothetical protein